MKQIIGLLMIIAGIVLGIYFGIFWAFIGGIVGLFHELKSIDPDYFNIGLSIVKIMCAGGIGWGVAIALILPGIVIGSQD